MLRGPSHYMLPPSQNTCRVSSGILPAAPHVTPISATTVMVSLCQQRPSSSIWPWPLLFCRLLYLRSLPGLHKSSWKSGRQEVLGNIQALPHLHPWDHSGCFHALFRVAAVGTTPPLPAAVPLAHSPSTGFSIGFQWKFCSSRSLSPASWDSSLSQSNHLYSSPHLTPGF